MSLYKRGEVWWNYFYVDGKRMQLSTNTSNRRQAETIAKKQVDESNARRHQLVEFNPDLTFGELAARYIAAKLATAYHLGRLEQILPYFADLAVVRLNKGHATDFRAKRHEQKAISEATINRDLSVVRHILYWAVDEQLVLNNPLARMKMARERRVKKPVLSVEEEGKLLAPAPEHLRNIIIAALDTGMRRGEITGQLWEHVDFPRRLLFVTRSKTPEGESREIPLTGRLHDLLLSMKQDSGVIFRYKDEPVVILKRSWHTAIRNAGIRYVRFHDLRHTFNTRLMEAGVMQDIRMTLMGHSSGNSVHQTYTHVELPAKRKAIKQLEEWVQTQKPTIVKET